jgi:hypothetical protein
MSSDCGAVAQQAWASMFITKCQHTSRHLVKVLLDLEMAMHATRCIPRPASRHQPSTVLSTLNT